MQLISAAFGTVLRGFDWQQAKKALDGITGAIR